MCSHGHPSLILFDLTFSSLGPSFLLLSSWTFDTYPYPPITPLWLPLMFYTFWTLLLWILMDTCWFASHLNSWASCKTCTLVALPFSLLFSVLVSISHSSLSNHKKFLLLRACHWHVHWGYPDNAWLLFLFSEFDERSPSVVDIHCLLTNTNGENHAWWV